MRLGSHAKYRSAGTIEFLVDDDTSKFYFLEVRRVLGLRAYNGARALGFAVAVGRRCFRLVKRFRRFRSKCIHRV